MYKHPLATRCKDCRAWLFGDEKCVCNKMEEQRKRNNKRCVLLGICLTGTNALEYVVLPKHLFFAPFNLLVLVVLWITIIDNWE